MGGFLRGDLNSPVVGDGTVAGEGVDASLLGTAPRGAGPSQVTYAGQPLHRYAEGAEPGGANGQGVNDVWFAVASDGTAAREPSPPSPSGQLLIAGHGAPING